MSPIKEFEKEQIASLSHHQVHLEINDDLPMDRIKTMEDAANAAKSWKVRCEPQGGSVTGFVGRAEGLRITGAGATKDEAEMRTRAAIRHVFERKVTKEAS